MNKCAGCLKQTDSSLRCPHCCTTGGAAAVFCSQECFNASWEAHKLTHGDGAAPASQASLFSLANRDTWVFFPRTKPFALARYKFTGALRAYPCGIPPYVIPEHIRVPEYFKTGASAREKQSFSKPFRLYDAQELERIYAAGCLAGQALDIAKRMMQPGVRTEDIDLAIYNFIIEQNAFPSSINYYGFPKASCISVNEVVCHGIPDGLVLREGDVVNVDVTVYFSGMHGDFNQTFAVGDVSNADAKVLCCAYAALKRALKVCRPGAAFKEIGRTIESTCREFGCSIVREYTGHGCGELFHSKPYVRHYCVESDKSVMEKGQVFTIEPMVNAGTAKVARWPDQWTVVTKDGKVSAAFERTLAITDNGYKILSSYDEQEDVKRCFAQLGLKFEPIQLVFAAQSSESSG